MWDLYVPRKTGGIVMIIQSKKVWFADQQTKLFYFE